MRDLLLKLIKWPLILAFVSVQAFAQVEVDRVIPVDVPSDDFVVPMPDFVIPGPGFVPNYNPVPAESLPADNSNPSDVTVIDYSTVSASPLKTEININAADFSMNMAALMPTLNSFSGGFSVDTLSTGLGPLELMASNQSYMGAAIANLNATAANSLLGSDLSGVNDRALESKSMIELMAAYNSSNFSVTATLNSTRALATNMGLDEVRTDGSGFYLPDGTYLGTLDDIKLAGAEAYLNGAVTDSSFCTNPAAGICTLFMIMKARADGMSAVEKARQGNTDPYDLFGPQSRAQAGIWDRMVLQFKDWYDSLSLGNSNVAPVPNQNNVNSQTPSQTTINSSNNAAKSLPSLTGDSYGEAVNTLQANGFYKSSNVAGGYEKWTSSDGSTVWFRPNGEIVRMGPPTLSNGKVVNSQYDQYGNSINGPGKGVVTGELLRSSNTNPFNSGGVIVPDPIFTPNNGVVTNPPISTPNNGASTGTKLTTPNNGPAPATITSTPALDPNLNLGSLPGFCEGCTPPRIDELLINARVVDSWEDKSRLIVSITVGDFTGSKIVNVTTPEGNEVVVGGVDGQGMVNLFMDTNQLKNTPYAMSGREAFKIFYDAQIKSGAQINGVSGHWTDANNIITNLDAFNRNINNGMTPEQAAANTPTGKYARDLGFTDVHILYADPGTPGRQPMYTIGPYRTVMVDFVRPPK